MTDPGDPLAELVARTVAGHPPPADGAVTVLAPRGRLAAVLAFTAHHVVVADVDPDWVHRRLAPGDLSAPMAAGFLDALGTATRRRYDNLDLVLWATGLAGPPPLALEEVEPPAGHPRVARALRYRDDVRTWRSRDGSAIVVVGRGLAGRWETSFELEPEARGRGWGAALITSARHLVPAGQPLFLQVSPGNVASLRAVLAAGGFTPFGSEVLFASRADGPSAP